MVSSEERQKVLEMIAEGTISVEDGAKLLESLAGPARPRRAAGSRPTVHDPRKLRVRVEDQRRGRLKVNVVLPMALVHAGLNIAGSFVDDVEGDIAAQVINAIQAGESGKIIDILDVDDGEHVQVFIE